MTATPAPASPAPERRIDPSMEDILASIRKIISDEESVTRVAAAPSRVEPPPPATPPVPAREEWRRPASVTPISPAVAAQAPPQPAPPFAHIPRPPMSPLSVPSPSIDSAMPASTAVEPPAAALSRTLPIDEPIQARTEGSALVSAATKDSITTAFQALTASVALTSAETVDRHVREMLRPMLRTWLDDNLPVIVEKLVRAEIERVARGGR